MVTPTLNICVPGWPLPLRVVAPVVLQASEEPLQLSPKTTVGIATLAEHWFSALEVVMLAGQVTVGFSVSLTVTVKVQVAVFSEASVTVSKTVVTPTLKVCAPGWPFPLRVVTPEVLHANDSPVQLSSNVMAGMVTLAEHEPGELFAV